MEVLPSLFTILVVVLLGLLSRKTGIFKEEHAKTLSSFVYYFGLPALFFYQVIRPGHILSRYSAGVGHPAAGSLISIFYLSQIFF